MKVLTAVLATFMVFPSAMNGRQDATMPDMSAVYGFQVICGSIDKMPGDETSIEQSNDGYCIGWMDGFMQGILTGERHHGVPKKDSLVCLPQGNTYVQIVHVTKKFISDHPEQENLSTENLVVAAISQAFPCAR